MESIASEFVNKNLAHPNKIAVEFFAHKSSKVQVNYQMLIQRAQNLAQHLIDSGYSNQRLLIIIEPGIDYIIAFWACIFAKAIAVPVMVPLNKSAADNLNHIAHNAGIGAVLTSESIQKKLRQLYAINKLANNRITQFAHKLLRKVHQNIKLSINDVSWIIGSHFYENAKPYTLVPNIEHDQIIFLQYTSGSTNNPKGVMVTNRSLLENLKQINDTFVCKVDKVISWLPPYHDMGLIGTMLCSLLYGKTLYLLSPFDFIKNPLNFLRVITEEKPEISAMPNFAYRLLASKLRSGDASAYDLSSMKFWLNGAEPVNHHTMDNFVRVFSKVGVKPETVYPVYGLAEATLLVSGAKEAGEAYLTIYIDKEAFFDNKIVIVDESHPHALATVSCGRVVDGIDFRVVNPEDTHLCQEMEIGEVWLAGHNITSGYWKNKEETTKSFHNTLDTHEQKYFRTGDLGFIYQQQVFITGRLKDLIILNGKNYYPQDIEALLEKADPAVRAGCSAAFAVKYEDKEKLVIVCEVKKVVDVELVKRNIQGKVAQNFHITVDEIVLIQSRSIPKTTSGKIKRKQTLQQYLNHELKVVA
ncbi:fatty acyl-AMP ligase [Legionella lytica]|uniref:Fatty acyl-AMP ligase n=1 Tax=Legionella lytica TaxID=96232 RepID=A0ABW8DAY8_9GAMM